MSDPAVSSPRSRKTRLRHFFSLDGAGFGRSMGPDAAVPGHGRCRQRPGRRACPVLPVDKNRLAQIFDCDPALGLQRAELQGVGALEQPHHRRGEKVEDIGSEGRKADLRRVHGNQFAGRDSLAQHLHHAGHQRLEDRLRQRGEGVGFAAVQAHHLLLHQALESPVGVNAVEVVERR
jgi:hypothetical protein